MSRRGLRFANAFVDAGVEIGDPGAIATASTAHQGERIGGVIIPVAVNAALFAAGLFLILLYRQQRGHAEYLWLGASLITLAFESGLAYAWRGGLLPSWIQIVLGDPSQYFCMAAQLEFVYTFAARRPGRLVRAYQVLLLVIPFFVEPLVREALSQPRRFSILRMP